MPKVMHIITSLDPHGAQNMLLKLLSNMDPDAWRSEVVSLTNEGRVGGELRARGIPVYGLKMGRGLSAFSGLWGLARVIRRSRPDIVQTWMYHADLVGGLTARAIHVPHILWNVRHSSLGQNGQRLTTKIIARLCGVLSRLIPEKIVCNSKAGIAYHCEVLGYSESLFRFIPNGFRVDQRTDSGEARLRLRQELNIPQDMKIVGMAARYHPQKDHGTFVRAVSSMRRKRRDIRFVLCGDGVDDRNAELVEFLREHGVSDIVYLLGNREDVSDVISGFDVAVLSAAYGEGFPNVVGEAMLLGTPCVVTDVGDSAWIVGDCGRTVKPNAPHMLADACIELLELPASTRDELVKSARERVMNSFSIEHVTKQYESLYESAMRNALDWRKGDKS